MTALTRLMEVKAGRRGLTDRARRIGAFAGQMLPGFFLSCAELMGIPSGLQAAWIAACAAAGMAVIPPMAGCLAAMAMRMVWGLPMRWPVLIMLPVLLAAPSLLPGRGNWAIMGWTALSLLPDVIWQAAVGTQADQLLSVGTVCTGALAAPVLLRALGALRAKRPVSGLEERIALGFLALSMVCGGGRMLLAGINLGVLCASGAVLCLALVLGLSAGVAAGMAGGLALALAGLPVSVSVCLACGGFLAGMFQPVGRRRIVCAAFACGCGLMLPLSGCGGLGVGTAIAAAALALAAVPASVMERVHGAVRRLADGPAAGGDAFAASMLERWQHQMEEMARAVPAPLAEDGPRTPEWWRTHLCAACPDYAQCQTMLTELAAARAEEVWSLRQCPEEAWGGALEKLRGLGCGRLYCLREAMDQLRTDEPERRQNYRRACDQRDMLITHLTAMAGAARSLAQQAGGGTWWDEAGARSIRRVLDEQAIPARLLYLRRVEDRIYAAIRADSAGAMQRLSGQLTDLVSAALSVEMTVERLEDNTLYLCRRPPMTIDWGVAEQGVQAGQPSGDHAWLGTLGCERFMAAVSDGMGQGARAGQESAATVDLLRLCTEAGYDREQTLTAVNGMMLLETGGERFATVDLLCVDLWTGQASLDKLGAAASWLQRGETLVELTGDALPLGIMETVASRTSLLKLRAGDRLVLMTDGIEDAFSDKENLRRAVEVALSIPTADHAAQTLLESAVRACETGRLDDMTAVVLQVAGDPA